MTQGYLLSPTIFNILVDLVVCAALREVSGSQEALHGLGLLEGDQDIVLYADNGRIVGRNPI